MPTLKYFFIKKSPRGDAGKSGNSQGNRSIRSLLPKVMEILVPLAGFLLLWGACVINILYQLPKQTPEDFVLGQKVPFDIYAQAEFEFEDLEETQIKRRQTANKILDIYLIEEKANKETIRYFFDLFKLIKADVTKIKTGIDTKNEISDKVRSIYNSLDQNQKNSLITLFDTKDKKNFFLQHLEKNLQQGVISTNEINLHSPSQKIFILDEYLRKIKTEFARLHTPLLIANELLGTFANRFNFSNPEVRNDISRKVIARLILPNLTFDESYTNIERKKAQALLPPVKRRVEEGVVFLNKGEIINENTLKKIAAHGAALSEKTDSYQYLLTIVYRLTLTLLTLIAGVLFLNHQHRSLSLKKSNYLLISSVLVFNIFSIKFVNEILLYFVDGAPLFVYPALPLAFSSLFLTILIGKEVGLTIGLFMALLASFSGSDPLHIFILGLFSSCIGSLTVKNARTRTKTFRASIMIALTIFVVEAVFLLQNSPTWPIYLNILGIAALNGFATLLLINLLLPLTEYLFGISTNISLLELSDLNQPLLKRLQIEAPGTYHHTLMVATLSEHAADAIGANSLLTRVCTYFHDIGKLSNPSYFSENSFGVDRHEDLSPRMSSLIILNHVKEGLAIAKKYKLKKPLRDVIASHHGTSLVYYFYQRAVTERNKSEKDRVYEEDFRYPGPLPVTKEASIISLADSCEAASRSLQKPTPQKIKTLVSEIIQNKILDGQLNDSELSMAEINVVETIIIKTLTTMLHGRIAYPPKAKNNNESDFDQPTENNGSSSQEETKPDHANIDSPDRLEEVFSSRE